MYLHVWNFNFIQTLVPVIPHPSLLIKLKWCSFSLILDLKFNVLMINTTVSALSWRKSVLTFSLLLSISFKIILFILYKLNFHILYYISRRTKSRLFFLLRRITTFTPHSSLFFHFLSCRITSTVFSHFISHINFLQ